MKVKIKPLYFAIAITIITILFIYEALSSQHLSYHFSFVGYGGTFRNRNMKIIGIPIYWFMLLSGFAVTLAVSWFKRAEYGYSSIQVVIFPVIFLVISFSGAKLLYVFENYRLFKVNGLELSGVSLFGAIFLVLLLTPIVALISRKKILAMYDFFTSFGLILLATTRTGCFFNGCCGAATIWKGTTPIILPVQLMEVICDLLILELCLYIEKKRPQKGYMYPAFMFFYSICRFILEFLRATPKTTLKMSHGQFFSIMAIFLSLIIYWFVKKSDIER